MKLKVIQLLLILVLPVVMNAQSFEVVEGDTINVVDKDNLKQGRWIEFNNGVKIQEGNYIDNKKEGIWLKFYPTGIVANKVNYVNNRPEGAISFYYETGEIFEEGNWKVDHWVGEYKLYHKTGHLSHMWFYNEQGKRTGEQKYYYETGQLKIKGVWRDGIKEGAIKEYFTDGSVKSIKEYKNGALNKETVKQFAEGEKKEGQEAVPADQMKVFDGNGFHKFYTKRNKLDREGEFRKGKLIDGKRYYYTPDGILMKTAIYQNAKVVRVIEHKPE